MTLVVGRVYCGEPDQTHTPRETDPRFWFWYGTTWRKDEVITGARGQNCSGERYKDRDGAALEGGRGPRVRLEIGH